MKTNYRFHRLNGITKHDLAAKAADFTEPLGTFREIRNEVAKFSEPDLRSIREFCS